PLAVKLTTNMQACRNSTTPQCGMPPGMLRGQRKAGRHPILDGGAARTSFGFATATCAGHGATRRVSRAANSYSLSSISYKKWLLLPATILCRRASTVLTSFCNERVSLLAHPRDERRVVMNESHFTNEVAAATGRCGSLRAAAVFAVIFAATFPARADDTRPAPEARIIVIADGSVRAAPDHARISSGVTTRAKTAKEASDANAKAMAAVLAALQSAGIEQKDIQTSRFSVQPVYTSPGPNMELRLTGFIVS